MEWGPWLAVVGTAVSSSYATLACLVWWLSGRFSKIERNQREILESHEELDQFRHEENLKRFERISVSLARLGSDNGTHDDEVIRRKKRT